jgi:HK97 family phage major capsid protein
VYADAAGGSPDGWREKMRAETWYTPEQALAAGLITAILPAGRGGVPAPVLEPAGASAGDPGIRATAQGSPRAAGVQPLGDGWVQDPGGTIRFDPDGDGDDDSTPGGDTDHDYWAADGTPLQPVPPCPAAPENRAASGVKAASVDGSDWDASKAWHNGAESGDPAAFYAGICAGKKAGDKSTQAAWALPYKYHPSDPPNAAGVKAALGRLPQADGLTNEAEAKALLQRLMKQVNPDYEPESSAAPAIAATVPAPEGPGEPPAGTVPRIPPERPANAAPAPVPNTPQPEPHSTATSRAGARPDNAHAGQEGSTVTTTLSIEDRAARRGEIEARLTAIGTEHGDTEFPAGTQAEWDTLTAELDEHGQVLASHEQAVGARRSRLAAIAARQQGEGVSGEEAGYAQPGEAGGNGQPPAGPRSGVQNRSPGLVTGRTDLSIYDVDDLRKRSRSAEEMAALCRDNALRAVERAVFPGSESREQAQTTVERLLARVDGEDAILAKRILLTGHPLYMRAWGKAVARLSTAVLAPDEIRALSVGTGSDGGFAVPFELDPTVLLTSNGAINPLRQISRVQTITGKEYDLVTSAGVTVSRSAEASAVASNNPTLVQPTIKAERVTGFVPFSVEIEQDWAALQSEMMMLLADAKDVEESLSFTTGDGTGTNAGGIIGTLSTASNVSTAATATLALTDLDNLEDTVPPRFRSRANWMASKTIYNAYRALMTSVASSAGDQWVRPSLNQPAELRGYPAYEDSDMVTTHASGDRAIILGDFGRGFIIVDRMGMSTELVPHLFDQATARPTGQRGLLAIWRNNSRVVIDNAFRVIHVL